MPKPPKAKTYITPDGDAAELDAEFFKTAKRGRPPLPEKDRKRKVTIMLDPEVIEHFRRGGPGWQTRVNEALRKTIAKKRA